MYFQELERLQKVNPELTGVLTKLDRYLSQLERSATLHITASDVAQAIHAHRDTVVGLLMASAQLGLLRLKFRVSCPVRGHGMRDFADLSEIPTDLHCDICGEPHPITADDVEYFFELQRNAVETVL